MSLTISRNIMNNINLSHMFLVMADTQMLMLSITLWKDMGLPK